MKQILFFLFSLQIFDVYSQPMKITTLDKLPITPIILVDSSKKQLLKQFDGKQNNLLRKKWTARSFELSDGRILVELYDRQAILINSIDDFKKLERIRFVKNSIYALKKNISYKIELSFDEGTQIINDEKPKRLSNFKSDMPEYYDFEVYELSSGQILFLDKSQNFKSATIYPDLKTLSSYSSTILDQLYGSDDDDHLMKKLASGDALPDYEPNDHLFYPKYLDDLIKNHKLKLIERKVYVSDFFGNLYKSERGYLILVDEVNQKNGAGNKMQILSLRIYETKQQVKDAQARYEEFKGKGVYSEHMYQKISDKYGQRFPEFIDQLTDSLPRLLNFDKEQLSFDSLGLDIVDEALKWNYTNSGDFDTWYPSVLSYYGQCYIKDKKDGIWTMYFDKQGKVWIPEVKLKDGSSAWDWIDFYKDLLEVPIPLRWAGDWDGSRKKFRLNLRAENEN